MAVVVLLTSCSTESLTAPVATSLPPPIDGEFNGEYLGVMALMPPIEDPDIRVRFFLESDGTLIDGWFVPEDGTPIQAAIGDNRMSNRSAQDGDPFLIDLMDYVPGAGAGSVRSIDAIVTIEDSLGENQTFLIEDARFDASS